MDKKLLLDQLLTFFLKNYIDQINLLSITHAGAAASYKADESPVTALDLALSDLIEEAMAKMLDTSWTFYSEEKYSTFSFPLVALDPVDGTREFIAGRPEWAVSLGLLPSDSFEGVGWIYNPMTKEMFHNGTCVFFTPKDSYRGEVSRSEWKTGLFTGQGSEKFHVGPMGSIAYKLGRLAHGKCDFVLSKTPKNIWDIAAGTILCREAGIRFYSQGKEVTSIQKTYEPPLVWCHESLFSEISATFA